LDLYELRQKKCVTTTVQRINENMNLKIDKQQRKNHWSALLAMDGGGIRGLISIQLLMAIECVLGERLYDYIDWTAGTSTGSFIAAGLAKGWSLRDCQRLYLRLKDQLFEGWARPYNTEILETFIKQELGEFTTLADIGDAKVVITSVIADHVPTDIHLFRSYQLPIDAKTNEQMGYDPPQSTLLWRALRCSSAAPSYFASVDNKFVDGGLMVNNPTMILMQQVDEYNMMCEYLEESQTKQETVKAPIGFVLSIGCGRIPDVPMEALDFGLTSNPLTSLTAVKNLGFLLVEQVTACDGLPVSQPRAWAHTLGAPYYRLNTPMSKLIEIDTKDDSQLVQVMWDTMEYVHEQRETIAELVQILKMAGQRNAPQRDF